MINELTNLDHILCILRISQGDIQMSAAGQFLVCMAFFLAQTLTGGV